MKPMKNESYFKLNYWMNKIKEGKWCSYILNTFSLAFLTNRPVFMEFL
jgi:hypothetical protein